MADMDLAAAAVFRGIRLRSAALQETVRRLRGPLAPSKTSLRMALNLFEVFSQSVIEVSEIEWNRNKGAPDSQYQVLIPLLRLLNLAATFVERHLAHGTRRELSESLSQEVRSELMVLGLQNYEVVISHGDADNFVTRYGDIENALFGPLSPVVQMPGILQGKHYGLFQVPRMEGSGLQWRPILLGHEVAHLAVYEFQAVDAFDLKSKFDYKKAGSTESPLAGPTTSQIQKQKALYDIAQSWLAELLCDAYAVFRWGPSAVASLADYFLTIGAMEKSSISHPPGVLRLKLAMQHLGRTKEPRLQAVIDPWDAIVPNTITLGEAWADFLASFFIGQRDDLFQVVSGWSAPKYEWIDRAEVVKMIADRLNAGIPGQEIVRTGETLLASLDPDIVNASWVSYGEDPQGPLLSLAQKAIESLDFTRRWAASKGGWPIDLTSVDFASLGAGAEGSVLTESDLMRRLHPENSSRLVITPLLQKPKGSSVDVRLGNRFIAFRRTQSASFDPLAEPADPRSMQVFLELDWTETFVLHPGELVLGATLEYLVLPSDLTAQVMTRSSYGRLGLLSATAVQIHPYFHGCLTLELVNLGTIPITLSPGQRVAQLVFYPTMSVKDPGSSRYGYLTGPEFSRVSADEDTSVLRRLRQM